MNTRVLSRLDPALAFKILLQFLAVFCVDSLRAQNIVERTSADSTANPVRLTDTEVSEFIGRAPRFETPAAALSPEARRISSKLEDHVVAFLRGAPWRPFQHTLGISGYELEFAHPDEMFLTLSSALPYLSQPTAAAVKRFLRIELDALPPYGEQGFDAQRGRARESYDVPESLRLSARAGRRDALGVYAFWLYGQYAGDAAALSVHWPAVKQRTASLLNDASSFDPGRQDSNHGEAQKLNGDLAGLLALVRLARTNDDAPLERLATQRCRQLLEWRVNLERVNPHLLERSDAATKSLHNFRLARYCHLVPEVADAVARLGADCGARNLRVFRTERNGWFLAFGDRLIGGENYTNPLHFPRALFAGAVFIEQLPADALVEFIDVPWCQGDFSFVEKCVYGLWALQGRPWNGPSASAPPAEDKR